MNIEQLIKEQRSFFQTNKSLDINYRIENLKKLKKAIQANEGRIMEALQEDLNKSDFEAYTTEIGLVYEELTYFIKNLKKWTRRKRVSSPIHQFPSKSYIDFQPYGVSLILSPWNYPFQLAMMPLIGAIGAGNTAIIKISRKSAHTSKLLGEIIGNIFSSSYIQVLDPNLTDNEELLSQAYDYIFFTGSTSVGKLVMEAAAQHLTPLTLELGGKSPCIVDKDADIELAAKRIAWGKFTNAGQTCVAPDYLLVHQSVQEKFTEKLVKAIDQLYTSNPFANEDYPKIIDAHHFHRLVNLLEGEEVAAGGKWSQEKLKIEPTVLTNVDFDHRIMEEEIFGPILPILTYWDIGEIITRLVKMSTPLALYIFSKDRSLIERLIREVPFGGGCVNDTLTQLSNKKLPFGGLGASGLGSYHGYKSFLTFSHQKSILEKSNLLDLELRYPPKKSKLALIKKILK